MSDWIIRHARAYASPQGAEIGIVGMIKGWVAYAEDYSERYGSEIGSDYVLGGYWASIGFTIRGLLNGELGNLDGGTLDGILVILLSAQGWDCDIEERKVQ